MIRLKALKDLNPAWAVKPLKLAVFTISAAYCLSCAPSFAKTIQPSKQVLVYEVYAGGIHGLQATLTLDLKKNNRYSIDLSAKTRGFLGGLVPWFGTFESHGWVLNDGDMRPQQHKSMSEWRKEVETKDYAYAKNGSFKSLTIDEHDKPPEVKDIDPVITKGTTDALTATLLVLENFNQTQKCEGTSLVFDGKRSFEQKFVHQGNQDLVATRYNIYEGPTAKCTVEVTPKEGKWHSKPRGWMSIQEQGRKKGTMPTVWVAQMKENAPAIPVKIFVKTDYGAMFMHLAEYQDGETKLVAEKRVLEDEAE
ncbi:MAG: DUF3108 domain-containing protein [Bdellovibrionales bacterium]